MTKSTAAAPAAAAMNTITSWIPM